MEINSLKRAKKIISEINDIREELEIIKNYEFIVACGQFKVHSKHTETLNTICMKFLKPYILKKEGQISKLQKEFKEL